MHGTDGVIPVPTDDQEPADVRRGHEELDQFERRGVGPLEVVEKDHHRARRAGDGAEQRRVGLHGPNGRRLVTELGRRGQLAEERTEEGMARARRPEASPSASRNV